MQGFMAAMAGGGDDDSMEKMAETFDMVRDSTSEIAANLEKSEGGMKGMQKMMSIMGELSMSQQFMKAIQKGIEFVKQMIDAGQQPVKEAFFGSLEKLLKILDVLLIPLKPFLFFLEMVGVVLEAAMTPYTQALWETFGDLIAELVEELPALIEQVEDWIEAEGGLDVIMGNVISTVRDFIKALVTTDAEGNNLMTTIMKTSSSLLDLAMELVKVDDEGNTLLTTMFKLVEKITELVMKLSESGLIGVLMTIIDIVTGLLSWFGDVWEGFAGFWNSGWAPVGQEGGVIQGGGRGQTLRVGEGGSDEILIPLNQGDPLGMVEQQITLEEILTELKRSNQMKQMKQMSMLRGY